MMFKPLTTVLFSCILLASCATLTNGPLTKTTVHTHEPAVVLVGNDSIRTLNNKVKLTLKRQNKPVDLTVITGSTKKYIQLKPQNSAEYYGNMLTNLGIGMLVEKKNPKRYSYPSHIYLHISDTLHTYSTYANNRRGELLLRLSLPYVNSFKLKPDGEGFKNNTGFWGITAGLDYFHTGKQYFTFSGTLASDLLVPVPAPVDFSGEHELMTTAYLSFSNNHVVNRFSFGYGIWFGKNSWDLRYYDRFEPPPPTREPVKKTLNTAGLIFPAHIRLKKSFAPGLIYRPTVVRFNGKNTFSYEHLISLDFSWKIPLSGR